MVNVYITEKIPENGGKNDFVKSVLLGHTTAPIDILRDKNGKPYLKDNPVYFNITHSGRYIAVAVSDRPVGVDMEVYGRGIRKAVLSSFSETEQAEITDEKQFLTHWTAREAYIKFSGATLADMLKSLQYIGGVLYCDGCAVTCQPRFYFEKNYVLAVCGNGNFTVEEIV